MGNFCKICTLESFTESSITVLTPAQPVMNQQAPMRLILVMVVLSERRILRYLNLRNWVHQKIDTHCSMTNFKAAHKFIHTFNYTFYFSSFYTSTRPVAITTVYGFRFINCFAVILFFM